MIIFGNQRKKYFYNISFSNIDNFIFLIKLLGNALYTCDIRIFKKSDFNNKSKEAFS